MSHLIHRIRVELQARTSVTATAAQDEVSQALQHDLPKALESLLNDRFPDNVEHRLDRLELDLGKLPLRRFREEFLRALIKEFERFPAQSIARTANWVERPAKRPDSFELETSVPTERHGSNVLAAFLHYVKSGTLPWWFPLARWREQVPTALIARIEVLCSLRSDLPKLILEKPERLLRMLRFPQLINALAAEEFPEDQLVQLFSRLTGTIPETLLRKARLAMWCFSACGVPEPLPPEWRNVVRHLLGVDNANNAESAESADTTVTPRAGEMIESLQEWVNSARVIPQTAKIARRLIAALKQGEAAEMEPITQSRQWQPETQREIEEGLPTESAGLVLLYPFFANLFRLQGWLDPGNRLLPERRWHAVHGLHSIAHARPARDEVDLVLEKILCGIALHEPAQWPEVDPEFQNETEALLRAVIGHWRALKDTSPEGLRVSFLARPGLLYLTEQPRIHVEARPYDVLLDRLPWSLDRVILPWLRQPISIHWLTRM